MRKNTLTEAGCIFLLALWSAAIPAQEYRGYPADNTAATGTGSVFSVGSGAGEEEASMRGRASASSASLNANPANGRPPQDFKSPEMAVKAFVDALRAGDEARLEAIFGSSGGAFLSSGDTVADRNERQSFLRHFDRKHSLEEQQPGVTKVIVGESAWPFPVPIVKGKGGYHFDAAAGAKEVVFRRIGRNERNAVAVCNGFVSAQRDYAAVGHDGQPAGRYAKKFRSDAGKQNGLYWPAESGGQRSPAGPLLASAADQGYAEGTGKQTPYHGYLFRTLTGQGSLAQSGEKDYVDKDGAQTGGFAVIAYPAEYGRSGVKSFIVNQDAIVYEKDLGERTAEIARSMTRFEPQGWRVAL
jgi:hypothetical protein